LAKVADIQKFTKAINELTKARKKAQAIDKAAAAATSQQTKAAIELQRIKREELKTQQEQIRTTKAVNAEKEREAKAAAKVAKATADENNSYKQLVKTTRDQKNESKRLGAEMLKLEQSGRRNSKEYRTLAGTYRNVTKAAQQGDAQLKKLDNTVGDNFRNVGNYSGALNKLKGVFLGLAGAFGAVQLIKGVSKIIVNFDQAQGDLLAISGKTKEELAGLTTQAKELGATTQFSATQITEMQIELAKLGFSTTQIAASTKAVANFAAATGAEIPEAAALAGSALRGFGLEANEMDRVVSVLGVATTKTALDFGALQTGLSTVAPVAKAFGFSIEDTTALLGQLANSGFDASSAATATRNILLNLADANGDLAKQLGRPIKSADDLTAGLQELQAKGIDLGEALELTDKRSVAAFQTFLDGSKDLVTLRDSITNVNGELEDMAAKRLDTISGQFTLLSSAFEGLVLATNEGTGAGEAIKNFLGFLAANLETIVTVLGKATRAWIVYKVVTGGLKLVEQIRNFANVNKAIANNETVTKKATTAAKGFGAALKSIGFAVIIAVLVEIAAALWDIASGAAAARFGVEQLALANQKGAAKANVLLEKQNRIQKEKLKAIELELSLGKITEAQANERRKAAVAETTEFISQRRTRLKFLIAEVAILRKQANENVKLAEGNANLVLGIGVDELKEAKDIFTATQNEGNALKEELRLLDEAAEGFNDQTHDLVVTGNNLAGSMKGQTKAAKELNTEFKNQIDLLEELNANLTENLAITQSLSDIDRSQEIKELTAAFDDENAKQLKSAAEGGAFDFTTLMDIEARKKEIQILQIEEARAFEIQAAQDAFKKRFEDQRKALKEERDELIKGAKGNKTALAKIETNYQIELAKIQGLELDGQELLNNQKLVIKENANNKLLDLEKSSNAALEEANKALVEAVTEFSDKDQEDQAAKEKKKTEKTAEELKKQAQTRIDLAKLVTDFLIKQSNERIAQLDKEIQAAEKQSDVLQELAINGNINAQQSLAEQNKIIAEANRAKAKEQQRQQRIQLAGSVYSTYNQKVADNVENPLAETIRDIALLQQFIANIPAFESGTEDTGKNGTGVDGRGGFHAVLHPNERVITKEQNALIGNLSNVELAKVAQEYNTGKLINGVSAVQIGNGWDSSLVIERLESLENTIKNKPETNIKIEEIINGAMLITRETKKGNTINYNRYRINGK